MNFEISTAMPCGGKCMNPNTKWVPELAFRVTSQRGLPLSSQRSAPGSKDIGSPNSVRRHEHGRDLTCNVTQPRPPDKPVGEAASCGDSVYAPQAAEAVCSRATSTRWSKAPGSVTARSARTRRSTATSARLNPQMNTL